MLTESPTVTLKPSTVTQEALMGTATDSLHGNPVHWSGVDSTTPEGFTLASVEYLGIVRTYLLREGEIVGRIEYHGSGPTLRLEVIRGGQMLGGIAVSPGLYAQWSSSKEALQAIADRYTEVSK
jgi:hypothetical protein